MYIKNDVNYSSTSVINNSIYYIWISTNVKDPLGNCYVYCDIMCGVFPELTKVRGFYYDGPKKYTHFWLEDSEGNIVDPTLAQYDTTNGVYEYYNK